MANQPIPPEQAKAMMATYLSYMSGLGVDMKKQTHTVSFDSATLLKWMMDVAPYSDEFRLCEAVYPPNHPNAGRLTVVIWPYKNGQPATIPGAEGGLGDTTLDPFNEGTGKP